jgi:competence protein ComEC
VVVNISTKTNNVVDSNFTVVYEPVKTEYSYSYVVKDNFSSYSFYYPKYFESGTILHIQGRIDKFNKSMVPNGFDAYSFNMGKNIKGSVKISRIEEVGKHYGLRELSNKMLSIFDKKVANYLRGYLLGNFDIEENTYFTELGVIRLLSFCGFNFYLILNIVKYILKKFRINFIVRNVVLSLFFLVFLLLSNGSFLMIRITLIALLEYFNLKYKIMRSKTDILCLALSICLIIKPYLIYNSGFIMSMAILLIINLVNIRYKNYFIKTLVLTFLINLVSLPFISYGNNNIYLLSILLTPLFFISTKYFITPILIITLVLPFLQQFTLHLLNIFEIFLQTLNKINIIKFNLGNFLLFSLVVYFALLIFVLSSRKVRIMKYRVSIALLIFSLFIFLNSRISIDGIYFLNVGQGDGTVVVENNRALVIDCFTNTYEFLSSNNINNVDLLMVTHSDIDHNKDFQRIIDNCKVKKIIFSQYSHLDYNKSTFAKSGAKYSFFDYNIDVLSPSKDYYDDNDNSLVIKITSPSISILIMGDASIKVEKNLIESDRFKLKSSILKVGHHGSSTSSCAEFIETVNPKVAIISCGTNNKFGFPSQSVIDNLGNITCYDTSKVGTLKVNKGYFHYNYNYGIWLNRARI